MVEQATRQSAAAQAVIALDNRIFAPCIPALEPYPGWADGVRLFWRGLTRAIPSPWKLLFQEGEGPRVDRRVGVSNVNG